jgi:hypothetical protein
MTSVTLGWPFSPLFFFPDSVISFVRDISSTSITPLSWLPWFPCHVLTTSARWPGNPGRTGSRHYSFHVCTDGSTNEVVMSIVVRINPHFLCSQTETLERDTKNMLFGAGTQYYPGLETCQSKKILFFLLRTRELSHRVRSFSCLQLSTVLTVVCMVSLKGVMTQA